jgi:hypothetical protein
MAAPTMMDHGGRMAEIIIGHLPLQKMRVVLKKKKGV